MILHYTSLSRNLLFTFLFLPVMMFGQTSWYVSNSGSDSNSGSSGSPFLTIGKAITSASTGDIIYVAAGTYAENLSVSKRLTIDGAGSGSDAAGNTIITAAAAGASTIVYSVGGADASNRQVLKDVRVTGASGGSGNNNSGILLSGGSMGYFTFDNIVSTSNTGHGLVSNVAPAASILTDVIITGSTFSNNGSAGIRTASHSVAGFSLTNCALTSNTGLGIAFNPSDNTTAQIGGVTLNSVTFSGNNSVADLYAFRMLGNMSLTNVDFQGSNGSGLFGLYLLGGYVNQASAPAIGTVTLNDVTVSGTYTSAGISFLGYSNLAGVSMTDVVLNTSIPTADRGHLRLSGVAGTLNLGNTAFQTPMTNPPVQDIRLNNNFGAAGSIATVQVDATNATFNGVLGSAMTLSQLFSREDRIRHAIDGATDATGFVRVKAGHVFVTPNSFASPATTASVQRGINAASAGDIVNVQAGNYTENVTVNKAVTVRGPNYDKTYNDNTRAAEAVIDGTIAISASDASFSGFEINLALLSAYANLMQVTNGGTTVLNNIMKINTVQSPTTFSYVILNTSSGTVTFTGNELRMATPGSFPSNTGVNGFKTEGSGTYTITGNRFAVSGGPTQDADAVGITGGTVVFDGNVVNGDIMGGVSAYGNVGNTQITNNTISGYTTALAGIRVIDCCGYNSTNAEVTITGNFVQGSAGTKGIVIAAPAVDIVNLSNNSITNTVAAIQHTGAGILNATCNWFGQNTGPEAGQISGVVNTYQWLVTADLQNPNCSGQYPFLITDANGVPIGGAAGIQAAINAPVVTSTVTNTVIIKIPSGTYTGNIDATGPGIDVVLAPGSSPGCVTNTGDMTLNTGDAIIMDIDGTAPCTQHDQFIVNGVVTLGGASLNLILGYAPATGDVFTIIDNDDTDAIIGQFVQGSRVTATFGGVTYSFTINYAGGSGNDVVLTYVNNVRVYSDLSESTLVSTHAKIQPAIDAATTLSGYLVRVDAGTYSENITINKSLDIRGPNYNISPNTGTRVAEAIIVPASTNTSTGAVVAITVGGVSFRGFTVDGDNTTLPSSGVGLGGALGTSIDAARTIFLQGNGLNGVNISENIARNAGNGIRIEQTTNYFATSAGAVRSTNIVLNDNKVQDMTGTGIRLGNSMYAKVTNNTVSNVDNGIAFSSFRISDAGSATDRVIENNTISARFAGIWVNLYHATPYAIKNNTITPAPAAVNMAPTPQNRTAWYGIMYSTVSAPQNFTNQTNLPLVLTPEWWTCVNNTIDGAALESTSTGYGYWFFYVDNNRDNQGVDHYGQISGGTVSNVDVGIMLKNRDTDPSTNFNTAQVGAHANVSAVSFSLRTSGTGIRMIDDATWLGGSVAPLVTKRTVALGIGSGVTISGGATGLNISHPVSGTANYTAYSSITSGQLSDISFSGQSGDYITLANHPNGLDGTSASFSGQTGSTATAAQHYAIEDKISHKLDNITRGLVRVKALNIFVTNTSGSVQRGIDAATTGDKINLQEGGYTGDVNAAAEIKNVSLAPGSSPGCVTINGNFTLNSGDNLNMEINSTVTCTGHDKLTVTGTVNLGNASLNLTLDPGFIPSDADRIVLIENDGTDPVIGTFSQVSATTVGAYTFSINYNYNTIGSGTGNDVALTLYPTVSCTSNVSVNMPLGVCTATVNNIAPTSTTGYEASYTYVISGATSISGSGDASGNTFNKGNSVVTYTVLDAAGNTSTCSFEVNIDGGAQITYSGNSIANATNKSGQLTLSAVVTLPTCADVTQTALRFINRDNGQPISSWITLAAGITQNTGSASYTHSFPLGLYEIFRKYKIGFELAGISGAPSDYSRNNTLDDVFVTISESCDCD